MFRNGTALFKYYVSVEWANRGINVDKQTSVNSAKTHWAFSCVGRIANFYKCPIKYYSECVVYGILCVRYIAKCNANASGVYAHWD
ncbi:hypothetical protein GCM10007377_13420 [Galliscardovia ingluviei]|uniref:Uncharacterized protein n=1 Tax=Galliscardovia ingluviei TaxID=1769422 RepID=A0A8J3AID6_9BIFI|nr:hypothetical protein GCM10007377_13420 [Galliscardovia ingluviei]